MVKRVVFLILAFVVGMLSVGMAWAEQILRVDLSKERTDKTQGPWRIRYDHRDLLVMRHPWEPSVDGDFASSILEVTVPADWQPPVFLSFYCSDDYNTDSWRPDGSWLTAEGFVGHRMKQVLVDDRAVWSQDVSDAVVQGESPAIRVELPVKPGQKFFLTLLAYDQVGSATVLPGDFYQSPNNAKSREQDPDAARFQTNLYWGDLTVFAGDAQPKPGVRSSEKAVRSVHTKHWPLPPFGEAVKGPVSLEVSAPNGVPEQGFPARCGVPFFAGKLSDPTQVRLLYKDKEPLYATKTVACNWFDGSAQWVQFDFVVKPKMEALRLDFANDTPKAPPALKVVEEGDATLVDAGPVRFTVKPGACLTEIASKKAAIVSGVDLSLQVEDEVYSGTSGGISVIEEGPLRTTVRLDGTFQSLDKTAASYHLYATAYAGLPYLAIWLRLFNDTNEDLPVTALKVVFTLPTDAAEWKGPQGKAESEFTVHQTTENAREIDGQPVDPLSPMFVSWKAGQDKEASLVVRHFREMAPKRIQAGGKEIVLDLVAAEGWPIVFTPGEAKSHEIWLAVDGVDGAQLAGTVAAPPVLQNAEYFCSTGVIGPAAPHEGVPVLHEHMANDFGQKRWEDFQQQFGVRDFPDSPYHGGLPEWCNNYYERMLGLWSEWFMSGDRAWYDRAFDVCRHIMDVAIIHSEVPDKDWLGAMHGPGKNHVAGPWSPNLRTAGLALMSNLTGEIESEEAYVGVADYCMRVKSGLNSPSIRDHAGPFDAVCTAYQMTASVDYIDDASARAEAVVKHMDMRRGVWAEEHGSKVYRGNVPWMAAQLARPLYLWYRATGDVEAAQAIVGLAESVICENTDWDQPGVVSGYSHNPRYGVTANYDLIILPMIFAAYELTEDAFFLDAAKAQWGRWKQAKVFDSPLNCYWNTPWLVWYLKHYGIVESEPKAPATGEAQEKVEKGKKP